MHTFRGGWVGHAFALATSNDAGGRKSRIRRSKEERKKMVESFIMRYQKSNNGNFPSLNLTHKEVGGSFYTVREIVREVIQENRLLAPPKESLDHDQFGFLEQHSLGSTPMEQKNDLSVSDKLHIAIPILPDQYQITKRELGSSSSLHVLGPELHREQIFNGPNNMTENDTVCDEGSMSPPVPNYYQDTPTEDGTDSGDNLIIPSSMCNEFEIGNIVDEGEVLHGNVNSDKTLVTNGVSIDDQDDNESTLQPGNISGALSHNDEQYLNKNELVVANKTQESVHTVYKDSVDIEILSGEKYVGKDIETPCSRTGAAVIDDDWANKDERLGSGLDLVGMKDEEKLLDSTSKLNDECKDGKILTNLLGPSPVNSKPSTTFKASELDVGEDKDTGYESSLPDETKANSCTKENSTAGRMKSNLENNNGLKKMDRIDLGTWEGAYKSSRSERNPVLALVKAFLSYFIKFWTE